jgi:hypothetical protein
VDTDRPRRTTGRTSLSTAHIDKGTPSLEQGRFEKQGKVEADLHLRDGGELKMNNTHWEIGISRISCR